MRVPRFLLRFLWSRCFSITLKRPPDEIIGGAENPYMLRWWIGGKKRKLSPSGRYLFTNTKFTEKAIKYAVCKDLQLVGWNYPVKGNIHDIIEEGALQPITCLTSLTRDQKRDLIGRDVMVCIDIVGKPEVLAGIGLKGPAAEKVLTEAQVVIEEGK